MELHEIISSGLLESYALGMTNNEETARVEGWIKYYPEVRAELDAIEEGMESYAMENAIVVPDAVKTKVFKTLHLSKNKPSLSPAKVVVMSTFWKRAAAASIILFMGSAMLNLFYYKRYNEEAGKYESALTEQKSLQQELSYQQQQNNEMKNDMNVVQSKYSMPVALHGLQAAPDAAAKIFWMKNTGDVYIDPSNLPEAPEGKQYQLWAIVDGKPVDAGLIITKKGNKYSYQKMKTFGKAEAFAVTLETMGGNPTPKGDMFVMGKM